MTTWAKASIAVALLSTIAGGTLVMLWWEGGYSYRLADFLTYQVAGQHVLAGEPLYASWQSESYRLTEAAFGRGYVYPPSAAVLLGWTTFLGVMEWRVLNLLALLVVAALIMRPRGWLAQLAAIAAVLAFPPTWTAWANGQVTPLLAAGFGLAWLHPRITWAVVAVGAAIKLFPLVLLVWALRELGWRHVAYGLAGFAAIVLLTLPIVGWDAWPAFLAASANGEPSCAIRGGVTSVRCALQPLLSGGGAQLAAFGLAGLLALVAVSTRSRPAAFALLTVAVLVATPDLNWPYWLLPLVGALAAAASLRRPRATVVNPIARPASQPGAPSR